MTIPLEALRAVRVVVSHRYPEVVCADGLASAMIIKDVLPNAEYRFVCHNTQEYADLAPEPGMLFVDITPPEARIAEFRGAGTIVLDHHKDKEELVGFFGERGFFAHEERDRGVSGALLAFEYVWTALEGEAAWVREKAVHRFAKLAGIRDTWQTRDPLWKEACEQAAILCFFPLEDWLGDDPLNSARLGVRMCEVGPHLIARGERETAALVKSAYFFTTANAARVAVLPSVRISDAAEVIGDGADVVVGFAFHVEDGKPVMRLSFRSRKPSAGSDARDVSGIAKLFGGGGHTHAAGAAVKLEGEHVSHPYQLIRTIMRSF